jgi:hypothetical protein
VLDTELPFAPDTPQYRFAEADLQASQLCAWRIVVAHIPPYSSTTSKTSSEQVQEQLVPLFERYNVQLVLSGNSHNYERSLPLRGGVPHNKGITYIVSGGGGNGLNQFVDPQPSWSAFRQAIYEHLHITVTPTTLRVVAIASASGAIFDEVTITSATLATVFVPLAVR